MPDGHWQYNSCQTPVGDSEVRDMPGSFFHIRADERWMEYVIHAKDMEVRPSFQLEDIPPCQVRAYPNLLIWH